MKTYLSRHIQVFVGSLGFLFRTPFTTLTTILVVASTLLLPILLYVLVQSANQISDNWSGRPQLTLFLQADIDTQDADLIFSEVQLHPAIQLAELVSAEKALAEFTLLSGLDEELKLLAKNPLPASIVVMPAKQYATSEALQELKTQLEKIDGIEDIRLDLDWIDRFNAIVRLLAKVTVILSIILGLTLLIIVGNTIRLIVLHRKAEIEVTKLVGGTHAFIRRPFLYAGAIYGFLGAILSIFTTFVIFYLLKADSSLLASIFGKPLTWYSLSGFDMLIIVSAGALLGWLSARTSVAYQLAKIQPR